MGLYIRNTRNSPSNTPNKRVIDERKKPYYDKVGSNFLCYFWSEDYNRYICTHMWDNKNDAYQTVKPKHKKRPR